MPRPRLDAVAIASRDLATTLRFYRLLGFDFPPIDATTRHVEPETLPGEARLMIDRADLVEELIGRAPAPASHSVLALLCDSPAEVDRIAAGVAEAGFAVETAPWDAFWGQRYATLADPDGYRVDLFAPLAPTG